ncbi:MAG: ABC transporter ATP-binding protein [Pseudomonadota bacterium]
MIVCNQVVKRFGPTTAVNGVRLSVAQGELMTLLGPSGCGKTTLLRCLSGSLQPNEGSIHIGGEDVTHRPSHHRNIGMVFQSFALLPHMTVAQNVGFPLMVRGISGDDRARRVREALDTVRLGEFADRLPRQLSGGQQQRVGLARAIVYRPSVLLMDEPLSNLDAHLREQMRFEISELQKSLGITTVYVTHDQGEALALSDRIAVMSDGRVEQIGTPMEIYDQPQTEFVAGFVGLANFLPARCLGMAGTGLVDVEIDGFGRAQLPVAEGCQPDPGMRLKIFVRPADFAVAIAGTPTVPATGIRGNVIKATYLGEHIDYLIRLDGSYETPIRVQANRNSSIAPGTRVSLALPETGARALVPSE